jgi:synaptic vesicle membrane protein VAT-1
MRQVWIPRVGGPEVLEVRETDDPEPGPGEVRIRVAATGVNFADVMARMGLYPDAPPIPCVVGYEVAGTIDATGEGVEAFAAGDRVLALTRFGGYSDTVVVPAGQVAQIGSRDFEKATAIPVNYLTAWLMLVKLGNVEAGERVLVHAAAGGVGQAALQICSWKQAKVIGTASPGKHARLRDLGVEHVVDYRSEDFEQVVRAAVGEVDIVLDAVGGASFRKGYRLLSPMGRLFMFGVSSFAPGKRRSVLAALRGLVSMPSFRPLSLMNENRGVFGVNLGHLWDRATQLQRMLEEILALVHAGELNPVVDSTFKFADAAKAHARLQDRGNFGKVLLVP